MLWKISQQKKTLSARSIEFITPDDATLYGLWLNDKYRLIPEHAIDSGPALVSVGCNEVFTLREKARLRLDTHSVYRPDHKQWVQVCRVNPISYFKEDEHGFTVVVPAAFLSMGHSPVNVAERLLAEAFVLGAYMLANSRLVGTQISEILESVHISPDERHMHMFTAVDHRDHLREFGSDEFDLVRDADIHFATAEIGYEAGFAKPVIITDRQRCKEALNRIVDA